MRGFVVRRKLDDVARAAAALELPGDFVDRGDFAACVEGYLGGLEDTLAGLPSLRFALETVVMTWLCAERECDLATVAAARKRWNFELNRRPDAYCLEPA